ncbi:MAG: alkyl sulfatase dimerization domain-containing protein [Actinomycetota bacterium]
MAEHPLALSTRLIDGGIVDTPPNRVSNELSELADGVAMVESFSHVVAVDTGDGLVTFDTSGANTGAVVVEALAGWRPAPVHSIVYTHGHLDHVGGSGHFAAAADAAGRPRPRVIGHELVAARFERYRWTSGYNRLINLRQFGGAAKAAATTGGATKRPFLPERTLEPDVIYRDRLVESVGDDRFEFNHCLGETDDHTWTWIPGRRMICAGDQFIWNFPNCGNPQKVQRYPLEWARSLRNMAATDVELFVPAHGLPIEGHDRIVTCLTTVADTLERLVADVVDAMNAGATLDEIVQAVTVPAEVLELPYLRPMYDEPEFVIRNVWRLYGGWWDGNPARLKPPADRAVGIEVAALAGGVTNLVDRALALSADGDHRLACQLIEFAAEAEPEARAVHEARSTIYGARRGAESSLMAKGIYLSAKADSDAVVTGEVGKPKMVLDIGHPA